MVLHCQRVQNNPPQVQSNAIQDNAVLKCISLEKLTNSSSPIEVGFSCIIWIKYNAVQESWIMTPAKHSKPKKIVQTWLNPESTALHLYSHQHRGEYKAVCLYFSEQTVSEPQKTVSEFLLPNQMFWYTGFGIWNASDGQFQICLTNLHPCSSRVFAFLLGPTHEYVEPLGQKCLHFNQLLSCTTVQICKIVPKCEMLSNKCLWDDPREPSYPTAGPNPEWAVWSIFGMHTAGCL